ncbi:hypothetical protein CASFOL_040666 [Castilleja foliolosa]|uniref:Uncharacterized protein n=1 Tax=Castilleja foliolosa TaxID=1961234 RepID=A0ABD3BC96_9LAMI
MSSDYPMSNHVSHEKSSTDSDDSFVVDIQGISPLTEKDIKSNSRLVTLQKHLSRKESSNRGRQKQINQGNASMLETSPTTATSHGGSTPEQLGTVGMGSIDPQVHRHHYITINNASSATTESKRGVKRFGFKHSSRTWAIDARRILIFFATL